MRGRSSGRSYCGYYRDQQADPTFYPSGPRGGRSCFRKNYYKGQQVSSQDNSNSGLVYFRVLYLEGVLDMDMR
ncbi:hypothetical protein NDU88_003361 [Pleurodeles waltl]|uniref:Uncharacterized protein n=1 Tax=Pleurodeles waltl TaxID=8319 RepID=A0AAV7UCB8_PLEWA|nr:hypothetical protein NDU88_003361 [Pleurodeles waltl]